MAGQTIYGPDLSLTTDQQQLLRTALSSNRSPPNAATRPYPTPGSSPKKSSNSRTNSNPKQNQKSSPSNLNTEMFDSPVQETPGSGNLGSAGYDDSPFLEFEDDGNFDWDTNGDMMFGSLPDDENQEDNEQHPKRKNSDDDEEEGEGENNKRHEGIDKSVKKPGRKPLNNSEPTTKRKAQNRAAQRAFRERKERHLKELESKVEDMEKASEHTNHENGRLRAQVEKLNTELKEYRKRLALSATAASRSPPSALSQSRNTFNNNSNDFQFAFPKFGDLPGSHFITNGSLTKVGSPGNGGQRPAQPSMPAIARGESSSSLNAKSPKSQNGSNPGSAYQSPTTASSGNGFEDLNGLFSPSILETASRSNSTDYISYNNGLSTANGGKHGSVDSFNSHGSKATRTGSATSITASPASSMSHNGGLDSSCGTTPEASADSPDNVKSNEGTLNTINEESSFLSNLAGKKDFCQEWAKARSNILEPVPPMMSTSDHFSVPSSVMKSPASETNGIDWMAQQNGGLFDPVLFGDYRDPQDNILNNGFFNDAFLLQDDFGTPFNTGTTIAASPAPKRDLMKEVELQQNGGVEEEVVPGEAPKLYLDCDKLWDRVAAHDKVQNGEVDMNELCTQLKQKAKCSGTGAVIEQKDVDDLLGPSAEHQKDYLKMFT